MEARVSSVNKRQAGAADVRRGFKEEEQAKKKMTFSLALVRALLPAGAPRKERHMNCALRFHLGTGGRLLLEYEG